MEKYFKLTISELSLIKEKISELSPDLNYKADERNNFMKCGDGTCAQTCSGGCGKDCSAFFSECIAKI